MPCNEELCSTICESLPIGVLVVNAEGQHIFVNQCTASMTGYSIEELLQGVWLVHPDDTEAVSLCQRAFQDGTPGRNYETRFVRKDGSIFWVSISWNPIRDRSGELAGLCTAFLDISDKKDTQAALDKTSERYRVLAENSSDMFWEMDLDNTFTYVSPAVRHFGYEPEEWIGHNLVEFLAPDEIPAAAHRREQDVRDPQPGLLEVRILGKDGAEIWVEVRINHLLSDGKLVRRHGVARNITQRKATEAALRESERRYKSIVENSSDLIMLSGPDGVWTYASPACREILGYEPEEVVGTMPALSLPEDAEWLKPVFRRAMTGERGANLQYRIITKNGAMKWVSHAWSPIYLGERLQAIVSVIRDITERKTSEEKLRQAHEELEQAYKLQREFLNNVTHEVRTPLTAVQGYTEMLMEGVAGPVSEEQADLLQKVVNSSEHLLDVLNAVLQIARMKSGRIALRPRVADPRLIIEKCIAAVLPQARKKGLSINVKPNPVGVVATYDEDKLTIIVTNLLGNAVKFTASGSIDVSVTALPDGCEITVSDTGVGIAESALPGIFEEFSQLDYPGKHKASGFGLGLAIVAAMVDAIGASLTVSSEKDVGTAFTLRAPALEA